MRNDKTISIIIVHYHVKDELFACLQSIYDSLPKTKFEIIIVDNDEVKTIKNQLLKKFTKVKYIQNTNKGFGQGNNVGASYAKGDFLFFLNPDTIVFSGVLDVLYNFLQNNKRAGAVAPFLLHKNKKPFRQQGVKTLTPMRAIFALSFINKIFPKNPIAVNYFIQWDKIEIKEVDVVPGTAFMIRSELYHALNGFDENFFLYFEEFDLCKRIREMGYQLYIVPNAKIIHLWERSTRQRNDIQRIFNTSRFYYLKKHFGIVTAVFTNLILNTGKYTVLFIIILLLAAILRFYQLNSLMHFIGDQAWFYLSARDIILIGKIPLVGITSSHTWLHQGPLWTYILAVALFIGNFNPLAGAYLTSFIDLLTVWLLFKIGRDMFSARIGLIASLFYAASPLVLISARSPYHTSFIPLFSLLWFYTLYKWTQGFKYGFPVLLFLIAVLYNFELSMVILIPVLCITFLYGFVKKTTWVKNVISYKILTLSIISILIPMIPMLLYDIHHGYPQTLKFGEWIVYKTVSFLGFPLRHPDIPGESYQSMAAFATNDLTELLFMKSGVFAWILLFSSVINLFFINFKVIIKRTYKLQYFLLLLLFIIPVLFYLAEKTNSDAYWPVFYPTIAFMFALLFDTLLSIKKYFYIVSGFLIVLVTFNVWSFITDIDLNVKNTITFSGQIAVARQIIQDTGGKEYNLSSIGPGSQYQTYSMNYQYLTWWLGHGPSSHNQKVHIYIETQPSSVIISKKNI